MKGEDILRKHYDEKYCAESCDQVSRIDFEGYPRDRFEAAVYFGKAKGALLDIGCGSGNVLLSLKDFYEECVGIELSNVRAQEARKLFVGENKISIITGDIEEKNLKIKKEYFDTILMIDVLEHLIDPIGALRYICGFLKKGGRIVVATPNIAKWTRRLKLFFGYFPSTASLEEGFVLYDRKTPTSLYDEGHLHYFTFRSLTKVLKERIGLSEVKCYGVGPFFFNRLLPTLFSECLVVGFK